MRIRKRKRRRLRFKPGAPPGTLIAPVEAAPTLISLFAYGPEGFEEKSITNPLEIRDYLQKAPVVWVNVIGLKDVHTISQVGELFGCHKLALEDVFNAQQRAKTEQFPDQYFFVIHELMLNGLLDSDQLSLFLGPGFVLTFQEKPGDQWDPVRERIRQKRGRIRSTGADYLLYALLDAVVDSYFPILEKLDDRIEKLEDTITAKPHRSIIPSLHAIKRDLLTIRRIVWPLREAINNLSRDTGTMITDETRLHLRDCYDHVVRIIEITDIYRELGSNLMELYLSMISHQMNEVIKMLTIISTIFMPLTFIVGIYGMNFDPDVSPFNMPELRWYYGYPFAWGVILLVSVCLLLLFKARGWFNRNSIHELEEEQTGGSRD